MNNYQDKWTRWHDKPCNNGEPRSNNGWIYSAYSKYLAPNTTDLYKRLECYNECNTKYVPLKIDRNPGDKFPPLSKDEVIGMVSLGLLTRHELEASHWNFCNLEYTPEKLTFSSIYKAAKALFKIRKEDRNYVWQNNVTEAYPLAFWLAPHDQYYVTRFYGYKATILQTIAFYLNILSVLTGKNKSVKMLLWLQLEDLEHPLAKKMPKNKWVKDYFGEEHPFTKGLK